MKRFLAAFMLVLGCSACAATPAPKSSRPPTHAVVLHGHQFSVELATTPATRARGLMQRTQLAADHGMLFVFSRQMPQTFWMKDTLIPLDILYFDKNHKLVSMQLDVPPCKAAPCPTYPSNQPALYVLELAGGTAVRIGANVGDTLTIKGQIGNVQP